MKKKNNYFLFFLFIFIIGLFFASPSFAQVRTNFDLGLGDRSPLDIAVAIINWGLGILALIAVVIIIYGGVIWMLSRGEEDKIEKAKVILRNGLIGLFIILAAWGIAYYILRTFYSMTNPPDHNGSGDSPPYSFGSANPFTIDHTNPANGDIDVSLCHLITAAFSLPLNIETVNDSSFKVMVADAIKANGDGCTNNNECQSANCSNSACLGDQVAGTYAFSESLYNAVWYPTEDYLASTRYHVELTTAIVGNDEVTIDTYNLDSSDPKRIFYFTTGTTTDNIPPKVDVINVVPFPNDEATEICRNTLMQASFSESLDPASVRDENVRLYNYVDTNTTPNDELDVDNIRFTSLGGNVDDTFVTAPENTLESYATYGLSLYSGVYDAAVTAVRSNYLGAIKDTCGNPLSGDFDDAMEGAATDDFTESTSAAAANGFTHQWTFTTGEQENCAPNVESLSYSVPAYYSEDIGATVGEADSGDSDQVAISGDYLYPFYDVRFYNRISAAGTNCFDINHTPTTNCFVSSNGSSSIVLRTPVGTMSDHSISVENEAGSDSSSDTLLVDSPNIGSLSPSEGPVGQFVTIHGDNFRDYNPSVAGSSKGTIYFGSIQAETPCEDGWDDHQIIAQVPAGLNVEDFPLIQVITTAGKYSNQKGFTITNAEPGPGLCELQPNCSNDGTDSVIIIGQNFGDTRGVIPFTSSSNVAVAAEITEWNAAYSENYYQVKVAAPPNTNQDSYEVFAGKPSGSTYIYSNGLAFNIPCQAAPELVLYNECDLSDTFYLPNPRPYVETACINSVIDIAFDQDMADETVTGGVEIYACSRGTDADGIAIPYSNENCITEIDNSYLNWHNNMLDEDYTGSIDINYEKFTFTPTGNLSYNTWYRVYIPETVTNYVGVAIEQPYEWHFMVRNSSDNCSVDVVDLDPNYDRITNYDSLDPCITNFTVGPIESTQDYTYSANPYNGECYSLRNDFDWSWMINNNSRDILRFTDDPVADGYNQVCLQGDGPDNFGTAYVTAAPSVSTTVSDTAQVDVDFGYCTTSGDCDCGSQCDLITSHCAPVITGFTPTSVGLGSCVSINGCYFLGSRNGLGSCTCTSDSGTCTVSEGSTQCLLNNSTWCELDAVCDSTNTTASYLSGGTGSVKFSDIPATYMNEALCGTDTWTNEKIIAEAPTSISAGDHDLTVTSYYNLSHTYGYPVSIVANTTPCLCQAVPARGQEGDAITLYGKFFTGFWPRFYNNKDDTIATPTALTDTAIYGENAYSMLTAVPEGATLYLNTDGNRIGSELKLTNASGNDSNSIDFATTCYLNSDCQTGCCEDGFCKAAEECNDCLNKTDCGYDACQSECVNGMCAPYIINVSPNKGNVGQPVTVQGCHFGSYYEDSSKVTFNDINADLACTIEDSWNNVEVKVTAPDGIFADDTEQAEVEVTQAYTSGGTVVTQISTSGNSSCSNNTCETCTDQTGCETAGYTWQTPTFSKSELCDGVDLPVLCNILPFANGPYSATQNHNFYGNNFSPENPNAFCRCTDDNGQTCDIGVDYASCDIDNSYTCAADPDDTETICSTSLDANEGHNYYDSGQCICVMPDNIEQTCNIEVGSASCTVTQIDQCYVNSSNPDEQCSDTSASYQQIGGNVLYTNNKDADWALASGTDEYERLTCNVPNESETGNVYVEAIKSDGTICRSNGMNFDVTCNSCIDCAGDSGDLMCDLSGSLGLCTSDPAGYCAAAPESCCGNTGCRETIDADGISDGGACYERPILNASEPDNSDMSICRNAALSLTFDKPMTTSNTEADYTEYISLEKADDPDSTVALTIEASGNTLTLQQGSLLDASTQYNIKIQSNQTTNTGIIDEENSVAVGGDCLAEDGITSICSMDGEYVTITFTTSASEEGCAPDYVDLSATDQAFIDTDYTFISANESQGFAAGVYSNGEDTIRNTDDDQAIVGIDGVYNWDYTWATIYDSVEILDSSKCPTVGIIRDYGTCSCNMGVCEKTLAEASCTIANGFPSCDITETGEVCYFDISHTLTCAETGGCECTIPPETCTINGGDSSCTTTERSAIVDGVETSITVNADNGLCDANDADFADTTEADDTCEVLLDGTSCATANGDTCELSCSEDSETYGGEFIMNQATQTATSGTQDNLIGWVRVSITGDGSVTDNWSGTLTDAQFVRVLFCDSADYLSSYSDSAYNLSFAYCRGSSADNLLPDFTETAPATKIGSGGNNYLKYYLFKNSDNEDLLGMMIYRNDIDGNASTVFDAVRPDVWGALKLENFSASGETTLDGYQAARDSYNIITAAGSLEGTTLYPNIYVFSINKEAQGASQEAWSAIQEHWTFNMNSDFATASDEECQATKLALIRDTQRVTDIGTMNLMLANYYTANSAYPAITDGSYIKGLTTSVWGSWTSTLGNALGQSLYTDPTNAFADATTNCPYNETDGPYYDEEGTCWDPINKKYKCPTDSYVYQYVYDDTDGSYNLYGNLELDTNIKSWAWGVSADYNPCASNSYSYGCQCFNYQIDSSSNTFYDGTCSSNACSSSSGFLSGTYCEENMDCEIAQ